MSTGVNTHESRKFKCYNLKSTTIEPQELLFILWQIGS